MPAAIRILLTDPVERMTGRVAYSQQLLVEHGVLSAGAGLGVDPSRRVTGYAASARSTRD